MTYSNTRIAIIGLGITGAAITAHLAGAGYSVHAFEQFTPTHPFGSSHGENRLFRCVPAEGEAYVRMAARAFTLWQELERKTGRALFAVNGALDISDSGHGWAERSYALARQYEVQSERLTHSQASVLLPVFDFTPDMDITYTPQSGVLKAEESITAFLDMARKNGAALHYNTVITALDPTHKTITVFGTETQRFDIIIISAGSWVTQLAPDIPVTIEKSTLGWFQSPLPTSTLPGFSYKSDKGGFYGMPGLDGRSYKIGHDRQYNRIDPSNVAPSVLESDKALLQQGLSRRFSALNATNARYAGCKITHAPNGDFIFQRHKDNPDILIFSPCSGHGFKYAPVYGEIAEGMIKGNNPALL